MAQLLVRNLEDDIKERLRVMAAAHGRSMEEEAREILRAAVLQPEPGDLGSRLAERFKGCNLDGDIEELRGQAARPADLSP